MKEKIVAEWKYFFTCIGINTFLRVEKDPDTENPSYWYVGQVTQKYIPSWRKKDTLWRNEHWKKAYEGYYIGDDWICDDFEKIIEKIEGCNDELKKTEICKKLLHGFEQNWEKYKKCLKCDYYYRYYGQSQPAWSREETKSTFLLKLQNLKWIPTTKGLCKPSEVFLDKPEIREVLGDTVPYLVVEIKNEEFIEALGINTQANIAGVLNYLKALIERKSEDKEKFEKIYRFLDRHFDEDGIKIKEEFAANPLIFVPGTEKKYYNVESVLWKDVSNVFGKNRIYLEKHYPKLKKFFVEKLGISEKPTPKDYANVLLSISKKGEISNEDKKIILRIYEELNRNLDPDKTENPISQESWWDDFIKEPIFFTNKGEFWSNDGDIFINDDNELYELLKDEEDISFLWLPEGYHPDKIKFFIKACSLRYISQSVKKQLVGDATYSKDKKLTKLIKSVVPYILRYLYWRENSLYEELKRIKEIEKIGAIEVYVTDNLKVEYSINVNEWKTINKITERTCILDGNNLYILKDKVNLNYLAIEFSKFFGEVKGLDMFLITIFNRKFHEIEEIMKTTGIHELPETEKDFLKRISKIKKIEYKEKKEKLPKKELKKPPLKEESGEMPFPEEAETISQPPTEEIIILNIYEGDTDKIKEKEWIPQYSPKEVPINVEEYNVIQKIEVSGEIRKHVDKTPSIEKTQISTTFEDTTTPKTLSREARERIGRWGEEYALRCIEDELSKKYPDANLVETEQGFRLEKEGKIIVEVIWLNKNEESGEHYDIKIIEKGEEYLVEVKSTKEEGKAWFTVSKDEWKLIQEKGDKFYIYRVYGAGTNRAKTLKICNPLKFWLEGHINAYPIRIEL